MGSTTIQHIWGEKNRNHCSNWFFLLHSIENRCLTWVQYLNVPTRFISALVLVLETVINNRTNLLSFSHCSCSMDVFMFIQKMVQWIDFGSIINIQSAFQVCTKIPNLKYNTEQQSLSIESVFFLHYRIDKWSVRHKWEHSRKSGTNIQNYRFFVAALK